MNWVDSLEREEKRARVNPHKTRPVGRQGGSNKAKKINQTATVVESSKQTLTIDNRITAEMRMEGGKNG